MSNSHYTIRNYQPHDFNKYVSLNIEAEKLEPTGRYVSPQAIREYLGRPNYSPEQDLFIVEAGGELVGYVDIATELTIGRVILDCWIHPEHRRKGLATRLLGYATRRAKEAGAGVAHVNVREDDLVARGVLSGLGFERVRRFLELRLDMDEVRWQHIDPAALGCRHMQRGEEGRLTQIQNRSFTGQWGFNPNTVEEIVYRTNLSSFSPEDVILACDGDKAVGYCWTQTTDEGEAAIGQKKGRIFMIGADPDYRGRGVGKKVLLAGLAYLRSKGVRVAELTVDSENQVACALYWSTGFKPQSGSLWYEKPLD